MQIVIEKESLIALFTVAFYAICGGDYNDVKNTVIELLDKVSYTPLPKGHGRFIDADKTISNICGSSCGCHLEECGHDKPCFSVTRIESAPTIIEADTAESEDEE